MKLKCYIKGKKSGIVGSAISNFWSYVLFVFVVIIFFVFFSLQERNVRENVIGSLESEANLDIVALNYLRTPVNFETESIVSASDRNFADFVQEFITSIYSVPSNPRETIDEAVQENLVGYNRIMIFLEGGGCIYDSRNQECQGRQISYGTIPEGAVFLPIPVKPNEIEIVEIVVQ